MKVSTIRICEIHGIEMVVPLRPSSSGKGMGRVYGRFQVQVPMGTKIYQSEKKNKKRHWNGCA